MLCFHNKAGRLLNSSTHALDNQILLPAGDAATNLAANLRRNNDLAFVQIRATTDVSAITKNASSKFPIKSFVKLSYGDMTVKDGNGNGVVVHTFLGNNNMCAYTIAQIKTAVLQVTASQRRPPSPQQCLE